MIVKIAAALVKPIITGCERKSTMTHILRHPIRIYINQINSAKREAYAIYHSVPLTAIGASAVAVMSEMMVMGHVDICGDDPKRAAMITGIKAV